MKNFNSLLSGIVDQHFPRKEPPCPCDFQCERLGGTLGACDNCAYCGTDGFDQERSGEDIGHLEKNYEGSELPIINAEEVF